MNEENALRDYEAINKSLSPIIIFPVYQSGLENIVKWIESGGWQIEDFIPFMQLIRVKGLLSYTCHTGLFDCYDNSD